MPRSARIVIPDEPAVYHVMSRTALAGYPLADVEKDFLMDLIRRLGRAYFAEVFGFCIMGNHFHMLVRMFPEKTVSDEEVRKRYELLYGKDKICLDGQIPFLKQKWTSLSEFCKELKQTFSRFYNKRHQRRGFFWGERFKSLIVEKGETLINCLAYIDLNPVRAGLVERPEQYRWNSIGYHAQQKNKGGFLSLDFGLKEFGVLDAGERLRLYRKFMYEAGAIKKGEGRRVKGERRQGIGEKTVEKERKKGFRITRVDRFRYRTRYFSDSGIIGSKEFVRRQYALIKELFQYEREKQPKPISGLKGLYSLKRLTE
ncbi:MAG: transposase [Thermodesulfobacteriota bacterium]